MNDSNLQQFLISWLHSDKVVSNCSKLTLNCIGYSNLPLVHKGGGFHGTPPPLRKPLSHRNFIFFHTIYTYTNYNHIPAKKKRLKTVSKWRPKIITWPKFEKPLSQKNFSTLVQSCRTWIHLHFWNKIF